MMATVKTLLSSCGDNSDAAANDGGYYDNGNGDNEGTTVPVC